MTVASVLIQERNRLVQLEAEAEHDAAEYAERAKQAAAIRDAARSERRAAEKALHAVGEIAPPPKVAPMCLGKLAGVLKNGDA